MGSGTTSVALFQRQIPPGSPGPPFLPTSADNGLSVDPVSGRIVLGNNVGGVLATLLSNREIPLSTFSLSLLDTGKTIFNTFLPSGNQRLGPNKTDQGSLLQVVGDIFLNDSILASRQFVGSSNYFWTRIGAPVGITPVASHNIALGSDVLAALTAGISNIGIGRLSLNALTVGGGNTAIGVNALTSITGTSQSTAIGANALARTTGNDNTTIGYSNDTAGVNGISTGSFNTLIGSFANISGVLQAGIQNILIGYAIDPPSNQNGFISIGNIIFATGATGINASISTGNVGIKNNAPAFSLDVSGTVNVPGTNANTYRWNAAAAAPGLTAVPVFTSYYGGNTNALGDPAIWGLVNVAGTNYKVPLYNV